MQNGLSHWGASHPGAIRTQNQDAFLCHPALGLFAVADGVGGSADGADASASVVEVLRTMPDAIEPRERVAAVRTRLLGSHNTLRARGIRLGAGTVIATTIVVLMLHERHFACLWVGDSRGYVLRDGTLWQLTTDHSVVQGLLEAGAISVAEAATHPQGNVITRAIGAGDDGLVVDKSVGEVMPNDRFLLCSDGLYKTLSKEEIMRLMATPGDAAETLVAAAVASRARDNVTAVVAAVPAEQGR